MSPEREAELRSYVERVHLGDGRFPNIMDSDRAELLATIDGLRDENAELRRQTRCAPSATAMRIESTDGKFWGDLIDWLNAYPVADGSTTITVLPSR